MTLKNYYPDYHEKYEYHGNTAIEAGLDIFRFGSGSLGLLL